MIAKPRPGHSWWRPKWLSWDLCKCCGLIALKNELTRQAIRAGCDQ